MDVMPDLPVLRSAACWVLPPPFGALAAWLDRMLVDTAAALTVRPLLRAEPRTAEGALTS